MYSPGGKFIGGVGGLLIVLGGAFASGQVQEKPRASSASPIQTAGKPAAEPVPAAEKTKPQQLLHAILQNEVSVVTRLLEEGVNPNLRVEPVK